MEISTYQIKSQRTVNKDLTREQLLSNMGLGIAGEGSEICDILKKHLYQGHELDRDHIAEEVGDVLFYIANLCNILNLNLEEVLDNNYKKLEKRYPKGFEEERSINR